MAARATILDLLIRMILALFFLSSNHPDTSYEVSSQLAFLFRRSCSEQIFKMATVVAILDIRSEEF